MQSMELKKLLSYTRQAVDDYKLIEKGDHIAVGISGGKDSLTLLYALAGLRRFYPKKFTLTAITVDLGYDSFDLTPIKQLCEELKVPYHIVKTEIARILFHGDSVSDKAVKGSPCALCAKMRKGALNEAALELGCNKVAYAHHMDDVIETAFLSMIFEGRFYAFPPSTHLDHTQLVVIRPLLYVSEAEVKGFRNKMKLPVVANPCPADGHTQRAYVKNLIRQINLDHPGAKKQLFHAVLHGNIPGWQTDVAEEKENSIRL